MKYFFITGEVSGDMHASNCAKYIQQFDSNAQFAFTGGDYLMEVTKQQPVVNIKQMAFMGFVEVLKNIGAIKQNFKTIKQAILKYEPDVLILVDYPGFNLRMAKWAHENKIKVAYYISPTVWAWKEGRVEIIKKYVSQLFVILPFEEPFYKEKHNYPAKFLGHPLIDAIENKLPNLPSKQEFISKNSLSKKPIIAVLPGSRKQEIHYMFNLMLQVIPKFSNYQFVIAGTHNLPKEVYEPARLMNVEVIYNQTYELMRYANAGIIKSGTSTLESALFELPQVVCYKAGALSIKIAKFFVNVKYISLPNLIMDRPVVKELIQEALTVENICSELNLLLHDTNYRTSQLNEYKQLKTFLGGSGASKRIAEAIVADLIK